jgi:hypothetical protein
MRKKIYLSAIILLVSLAAAKIEENVTDRGHVQLRFENVMDGKPLKLRTTHYKNANGDDFTVSAFKYYISNISFVMTSGKRITIPESYYLLDQEKPASLQFDLAGIPAGTYKAISFIIGVDSMRNLKGEQKGALDPANKMYWSWKSGYIFLKLTGNSAQSPAGEIHFDVGGIKPETNTIRKQELTFKQPFKVSGNKENHVELSANVAQLFKGKETIDFSETYKCMGGPKAVKIADNYGRGMFRIIKVQNL